jgi:hypothetical protein
MAGPAYSTAAGYSLTGPSNPDGTVFTDTVDGTPVVGPQFAQNGQSLIPAISNPTLASDVAGISVQNAILIEWRILTALMAFQLGSACPDIEQMRADELWNTTIGQGVV